MRSIEGSFKSSKGLRWVSMKGAETKNPRTFWARGLVEMGVLPTQTAAAPGQIRSPRTTATPRTPPATLASRSAAEVSAPELAGAAGFIM